MDCIDHLLQPGEEHDGQQQRATDRIWSKASYRLREIVENPGNRVMYYLLNGPEQAFVGREVVKSPGNRVMYYLADGSAGPRIPEGSHGPEQAFVSEELMLIPEDTELPPDYVQEW